jgi:hypothetical protein
VILLISKITKIKYKHARMNKEIVTHLFTLALRKELSRRFSEFRVIFKQNGAKFAMVSQMQM